MNRFLTFVLCLSVCSPTVGEIDNRISFQERVDGWRVWTSANQRHQCVAKKLSLDGTTLHLLKRNGEMIAVPLKKLNRTSRLTAVKGTQPVVAQEPPAEVRPLDAHWADMKGTASPANERFTAYKERRRYRRLDALARRRQIYGGRNHVYAISSPPVNYGFIPTIRNPPLPVYGSSCSPRRATLLASVYGN